MERGMFMCSFTLFMRCQIFAKKHNISYNTEYIHALSFTAWAQKEILKFEVSQLGKFRKLLPHNFLVENPIEMYLRNSGCIVPRIIWCYFLW